MRAAYDVRETWTSAAALVGRLSSAGGAGAAMDGVDGLIPIASILPPAGIAGAVWLSVMTMSYLLPSLMRHWPPTSGVLATFLAANGGTPFAVPLNVTDDGVEIGRGDRLDGRPSCRRARRVRLSTSIATSNSECTKPIGCVHCFLVAAA